MGFLPFLSSVFAWLNDQLLRMQWLSDLFRRLLEDVIGLDTDGRLGGSLHFFLYDVVKILVLLSVLILGISYVQSFFPPERTRRILGRFRGVGANLLGALLGTVTPFCSCSSIPLFIGFTKAGLPVGVTFSFLISSPLVDLASVLLLASIFGWRTAIAYVVVGVLLAVAGGTLIDALKMGRFVEGFVTATPAGPLPEPEAPALSPRDRLRFAAGQVRDIVRRVWPYVLGGVAIGAAIHDWIPERWIVAVLGQGNAFSVPIATLVGVPMYADIFGTLPIAEALVGKGVGIGTVLAFMMAVTALSLPSMVLLKKVVKIPLLLTFAGAVTVGIMAIGFLFDAVGGWLL